MVNEIGTSPIDLLHSVFSVCQELQRAQLLIVGVQSPQKVKHGQKEPQNEGKLGSGEVWVWGRATSANTHTTSLSSSITLNVFQRQNEVLFASQHSNLIRQSSFKKILNQPIKASLLKFLSIFLFYKIICVWERWPRAIHICLFWHKSIGS